MKHYKQEFSTKSQVTVEFFIIISLFFIIFVGAIFAINQYIYTTPLNNIDLPYNSFKDILDEIKYSKNNVEYIHDFQIKYGHTIINITSAGEDSFIIINSNEDITYGYITKISNDNPEIIINNILKIIKNNTGIYILQG
jgi:hypothetical protein